MIKNIDRMFCILLAVGTIGHLFGTIHFFEFKSGIFVWSLSGVLAGALLVTLNWLRNFRPRDRAIRWVALVGNLAWIGIVLLFGNSLGNYLDPRVLFHGFAAAGLVYFSSFGTTDR